MLDSRPDGGASSCLLFSQPFEHAFPNQSTRIRIGEVFETSVTHVVDARVDDDRVGLEPHAITAQSLDKLPGVVSVEGKVDDVNTPVRVSLPQKTPHVGVDRLVVRYPPA